jgi:hypothetical protein
VDNSSKMQHGRSLWTGCLTNHPPHCRFMGLTKRDETERNDSRGLGSLRGEIVDADGPYMPPTANLLSLQLQYRT